MFFTGVGMFLTLGALGGVRAMTHWRTNSRANAASVAAPGEKEKVPEAAPEDVSPAEPDKAAKE